MSTLRFRAWHVEQKRMYSPEEMGADELTLAVDGRGLVNVNSVSPRLSQYAGDRMIVMQSTGLKDKNGREIFEGDILWAGEYSRKTGRKQIAETRWWVDRWVAFTFAEDFDDFPPPIRLWDEYEVIGNIHENPDLLPARSGN